MKNLLFEFYLDNLYPKVYQYYGELKKQENLTKVQLEDFQVRKLNELIKFCRENSKFYKELWNKYDVVPELKTLSDFDTYPLVTKQMLSEGLKNKSIVPINFASKNLKTIYTTGSTGLPFGYPIDIDSSAKRFALELRSFDWYDFKLGGDKRVKLWRANLNLTFKDKLREFIYTQKTFSIYDPVFAEKSQLNEERAKKIIIQLNKYKPSNIDGFVSALTYLAKYILDANIKLEFLPKSIVTGAEFLSIPARNLIFKAFNAPVFNRYGGTESGLIAHETIEEAFSNHYLHISEDSIFTEIYNKDKPIFDGEGAIVFTDFSCRSMPFVKYINGDIATCSQSANSSSPLPFKFFTDIKGRINDYFLLPNGNLLSSHIWHNYFREASFINQFQIVQEEIHLVKVFYVLNENHENFMERFNLLKIKVQKALPGCIVKWEQKNEIDYSKGGKFRHSISKVKIDLNDII